MLNRLAIRNYAIIEELEIDFSPQLNVITGETGAGKSIIAGALGLILGNRADSSVLVSKEKKCVVEGSFDAQATQAVRQFLKDNELDLDDELVIRREITPNGKSRAFVNDTPVNLNQLHALSSLLVDLHQQFDNLDVANKNFQRDVLDALAGNGPLLEQYQKLFFQWQQARKELQALNEQKSQFEKESDYNRFQFEELDEAGFVMDELEEIDRELKLLTNAGAVKETLAQAHYELKGKDTPVAQQLKSLVNQLSQYNDLHPGLSTLTERLLSALLELTDIAAELETIADHMDVDPGRMEQLNERLSLGYRLLKKHGVKSTGELLEIRQELANKMAAVLNIDESIKEIASTVHNLVQQAEQQAAGLSARRAKVIRSFETNVNQLLAQVGMPNARLQVELKKQEPDAYGSDAVEFLFNANIPATQKSGGEFLPLKKVASGGELSRLMLAIKSLVATSLDLPTLIFDEIDTGISGEAARQVGIIMKDLSASRQVICITHQPQIAGKATAHFFVYKEIAGKNIQTNIRQLSMEERITTIAKMLSGEKPTAAAIENAREMVMN